MLKDVLFLDFCEDKKLAVKRIATWKYRVLETCQQYWQNGPICQQTNACGRREQCKIKNYDQHSEICFPEKYNQSKLENGDEQ